ncbi:MAG: prenyltransferase/squalene oxidase repeat-containing protein [Planctomycetota bacterium]
MRSILLACIAAVLCMSLACGKVAQAPPAPPAPVASVATDADLTARVDGSIVKGVAFLMTQLDESGVCMVEYEGKKFPEAGVTGLVILALTNAPDPDEKVKAAIQKGAAFLAAAQKEDGGVYLDPKDAPATYVTSVAIMVLNTVDKAQYAPVIAKAQTFLIKAQGADINDKWNYGGIGYGSNKTSNLSTTQFAIEALRTSGCTDKEAYQRALTFLSRCQNYSEYNDLEWSTNDGGAVYSPHESKAGEVEEEGGTKGYKSYGTMTYAEIKSYIYAGLTKDDPRVLKALEWIKANYTIDANPGMQDGAMGLYYYFLTMAKTLSVLGVDKLEDTAGIKHDWKRELSDKMISLQQADGSWQNSQPRWFEGMKPLATAYSVIALGYCR